MTDRGMGWVYQRGRRWWIGYRHHGKVYQESSRSTRKADAVALLRLRLSEVAQGRPAPSVTDRTTFEDLERHLLAYYRRNRKQAELTRAEYALAHLRRFFGGDKASAITTQRVALYVDHRLSEPMVVRDRKGQTHVLRDAAGQPRRIANATINRELEVLRRMFTLAFDDGLVAQRPKIPRLEVDNVRKGFFERDQYEAVRARLPEYLQPVAEAAYITGWRVKSELLTRGPRHVDFEAGWLRLDPGETKNGDGRMFPLTPELRALLERQVEQTRAFEAATGRIVPWLFHRRGQRIQSFRKAWKRACEAAGVPGRIPHDFRRTAVRNLERASVPRSVAMQMVGHRTEAIYRRYAIVPEADLKAGAEKLATFHARQTQAPQTVVPMPEAQSARSLTFHLHSGRSRRGRGSRDAG